MCSDHSLAIPDGTSVTDNQYRLTAGPLLAKITNGPTTLAHRQMPFARTISFIDAWTPDQA